MKKILSLFLLHTLSFIPFAQENKSNDSLQPADTNNTAIERLLKQNDSIIQLNARYEDSMRMLFAEKNNKKTDGLISAEDKEDKTNRQLYFRIGLAVFFLALLLFRLLRKRKK